MVTHYPCFCLHIRLRVGKPPIECAREETTGGKRDGSGSNDALSGCQTCENGILDSSWVTTPIPSSVEGDSILLAKQGYTKAQLNDNNNLSDALGYDDTDELGSVSALPTLPGKPDDVPSSMNDETIEGLETRCAPLDVDVWLKSYGTITCGAELMRTAWPRLKHVFSVRRENDVELPVDASTEIRHGPRPSHTLLQMLPVDLLVVERGFINRPRKTPVAELWEHLVSEAAESQKPKVILESWCAQAVNWENGPTGKAARIRWERLGYESRFRRVSAMEVGGALDQCRLLVARVQRSYAHRWTWGGIQRGARPRPMSNLLTPDGLLSRRRVQVPMGAVVHDAQTEPMPGRVGAWIRTEKRTRRLTRDEMGRGLGIPKHWDYPSPAIDPQCTTSVFHWEYVGQSFVLEADTETWPTLKLLRPDDFPVDLLPVENVIDNPDGKAEPFSWRPPDLSIDGVWSRQRIQNLYDAVDCYPESERAQMIKDGLEALDRHRTNYNELGPDLHSLQILWWEFPMQHWNALREGSRMNFLSPPKSKIHSNTPMDEEQLRIAVQFVDELLDIGALGRLPDERPIKTTTPLFCVPKPGQPGQWRVIANMLDGGQNEVVGTDPVYLPRVTHILDQMYTGGYTAIVDASKFFYQFDTHPDDRPWLGLVHPLSGELLEWLGLPMGAGNSPALGGRYGLAFLRKLRERAPAMFGTTPHVNCWWSELQSYGSYDPALGHGMVLLRSDGKPGVKIWVFVDDFAIHGPDYASTCDALRLFFDAAVEVGLLCNPVKCDPPSQVAKYCGFLFDTRRIPQLRIPVTKRERGHAMIQHLLSQGVKWEHSRLTLAIVAGTLEAMAEATPLRLGHTYLRRLHSLIRPPGLGTGAEPYYTRVSLTPDVLRDLEWWDTFLRVGDGRYARSERSGTLIPSWGDGSGTGAGGTLGLPDCPLQMWMGQWSPIVYSYSSNWKELKTLLLTLRRLKDTDRSAALGTTVFYFTDNSTTYWIAASGSSSSPGLHALIEEIRLLELELQCRLQVIHVPGVAMIHQGTDGLSRGVWSTVLHELPDQSQLTASVFEPLQPDEVLVNALVHHLGLGLWRYQPWDAVWDARDLFGCLSVWFPPPEVARQAITFMLEAWVEQPLDTSAIFIVPRVIPAFWHGLSRYIQELPLLRPDDPWLPMSHPPRLPIPVVILYLAPHVRSLSPPRSRRMEPFTDPGTVRWHTEQAERLRGLPPRSLDEGTSGDL